MSVRQCFFEWYERTHARASILPLYITQIHTHESVNTSYQEGNHTTTLYSVRSGRSVMKNPLTEGRGKSGHVSRKWRCPRVTANKPRSQLHTILQRPVCSYQDLHDSHHELSPLSTACLRLGGEEEGRRGERYLGAGGRCFDGDAGIVTPLSLSSLTRGLFNDGCGKCFYRTHLLDFKKKLDESGFLVSAQVQENFSIYVSVCLSLWHFHHLQCTSSFSKNKYSTRTTPNLSSALQTFTKFLCR